MTMVSPDRIYCGISSKRLTNNPQRKLNILSLNNMAICQQYDSNKKHMIELLPKNTISFKEVPKYNQSSPKSIQKPKDEG